jgi:DNA polymerase-3 subunit epsilon
MGWLDFLKKEKIRPTPFVLDYKALFNEKIPKNRTIDNLSFTVLDTEKTGLNTRTDYIISFGSIRVQGYSIKVNTVNESYLKLKKQDIEAIKVHEIIKSEDFIALEDFVGIFLREIGNSIVVAHHAGFDVAMLERAVRSFGLKRLQNPILDTVNLALRVEIGKNYNPRLVNKADYSLDKLCKRYHVPLEDRHTASGDAFITAQLLVKLLKIAEKKGIKTYKDLMGR